MSAAVSFVLAALLISSTLVDTNSLAKANALPSQKEDLSKITLALLDIRDVLADYDDSNEGYKYKDKPDFSSITEDFSLLVNATTTRLNDLSDVANRHGEFLAYLLNRVNEMHDTMEVMAKEIIIRNEARPVPEAKPISEARLDALAKVVVEQDQTIKRLQENFAAMAREVLLKDLITVELKDRLEEVSEGLRIKTQEVGELHERLDAFEDELKFTRKDCCDYSYIVRGGEGGDPDIEALASATSFVYANNSVDTAHFTTSNKSEEVALTKGCSPPYEKVGHDCFYIHTKDVRTWTEAREFCRQQKGDLAEPEDLFSLRAHLQLQETRTDTSRGFFWLGGTDVENPGVWLWVSGAPVSMGVNVWAAGQPDVKQQHCLYLDSSKQFKAGNLGCQNYTYFICELKMT